MKVDYAWETNETEYDLKASPFFEFDYASSSTGAVVEYFSFGNAGYGRLPGPDLVALTVYEKGGDRTYKSL